MSTCSYIITSIIEKVCEIGDDKILFNLFLRIIESCLSNGM